jgi:hypothetical protein
MTNFRNLFIDCSFTNRNLAHSNSKCLQMLEIVGEKLFPSAHFYVFLIILDWLCTHLLWIVSRVACSFACRFPAHRSKTQKQTFFISSHTFYCEWIGWTKKRVINSNRLVFNLSSEIPQWILESKARGKELLLWRCGMKKCCYHLTSFREFRQISIFNERLVWMFLFSRAVVKGVSDNKLELRIMNL